MEKVKKWFDDNKEKFKSDLDYVLDGLILEFTHQMSAVMKEKDISRSKLASILMVDKSMITRILNGNPNLTLKTIVSIGMALDSEVKIELGAFSEITCYEPMVEFVSSMPKIVNFINRADKGAEIAYCEAA